LLPHPFPLLLLNRIQPAIVLIDHGHFQYNTVALGLSLWSFYFITKGSSFYNCMIGSFLFCMALNFKQMTLYYAPAVFMYLLGRCFFSQQHWFLRFSLLATTVILSFAILWWPFFLYPFSDSSTGTQLTSIQSVSHVIRRLFPFQRGLFEGKVANLWCALSTKPISIRSRIPAQIQPLSALLLTLLLLIPLCIKLFQTGIQFKVFDKKDDKESHNQREQENSHLKLLLLGSTASGLTFFLASFQVHEKSILMALSTISMLFIDNPHFVSWFSIVSVWTLWPLLTVDKLRLAYIFSNTVFCMLVWTYSMFNNRTAKFELGIISKVTYKCVFPISYLLMMSLHVAEFALQPPNRLPDLYPVLWSVFGCSLFCWSWLYCSHELYTEAKKIRGSMDLKKMD